MTKTNKNIVLKYRARIIRELLAEKSIARLELETALLALDILSALKTKAISPKAASKYFTVIAYRIDRKVERKATDNFSMLLAEAMLLDELGKKYGPKLSEIRRLAYEVLAKNIRQMVQERG